MAEFVDIDNRRVFAVRHGEHRVGTVWRTRNGGWRYRSMDSRVERAAYTQIALKREIEAELRKRPARTGATACEAGRAEPAVLLVIRPGRDVSARIARNPIHAERA